MSEQCSASFHVACGIAGSAVLRETPLPWPQGPLALFSSWQLATPLRSLLASLSIPVPKLGPKPTSPSVDIWFLSPLCLHLQLPHASELESDSTGGPLHVLTGPAISVSDCPWPSLSLPLCRPSPLSHGSLSVSSRTSHGQGMLLREGDLPAEPQRQ